MNALAASGAILTGIFFSIVGDIFLKRSEFQNLELLGFGVLFYALGAIPVAFAFRKLQFGTVFLVWEAFSVIIALIIANVLFNEPLSIYKYIALFLAVGALCFSYL